MLGLVWAVWHVLVDIRHNNELMSSAWSLQFAVLYLATLSACRALMSRRPPLEGHAHSGAA